MSNIGEEADPEAYTRIQKSLDDVGISMIKIDGSLKPVGKTLEELSKKWNTLSDAERNNLAQNAAGKQIMPEYTVMYI